MFHSKKEAIQTKGTMKSRNPDSQSGTRKQSNPNNLNSASEMDLYESMFEDIYFL